MDTLKEVEPGWRPKPRLPDWQQSERTQELRALLGRSMHLDPGVDRISVLRRDRAETHETLGLCEHVLVEDGAPLSDKRKPNAARAAAADEVLHRAEHPLLASLRPLRGERVGLVDHQVKRLAVTMIEPLAEGRHKADLLALSEMREV